MGDIFMDLLNTSITASWLIIAVLLLRLPLKKTPKWISCLLWGMVALRLICPISLESPFSMVPTSETIKSSTVVDGEIQTFIPSIDSNLDVVENTINPILQESFSYEPSESVSPLQVVTSVAGIVWLCGMVMMFLYMVISRFRLHLLVRESVQYRKNIYLCDGISSPFILGVIKPRIYLNSGLKEEEMQCIVAHERAHFKRKDHWWKPLGFLLLCIYWFNPLCWVAYSLLCRDIEMACDEKVIRDMSFSEKKAYSKVLVSCGQKQRRLVMACPLAFGEVGVKERVKSVINYKKPAFWVLVAAICTCFVVAVCFLTNPLREYQIRITIPAGSTAEFCYSEEEISPKGNTLTLSNGDGLGDCSVVLKPVAVREENACAPAYMTPGMPVKTDVEKDVWYQIGVNMQNPGAEDIHVYVTVKNVEVRIADSDHEEETEQNNPEAVDWITEEINVEKRDVTHDGVTDYIVTSMSYDPSYVDVNAPLQDRIMQQIMYDVVSVKVYEGENDSDTYREENQLWSQEYSRVHVGNGQLSIVSVDGKDYMLTSSLYVGQGFATWDYEVFSLNGTEKETIDKQSVEFEIGAAASYEEFQSSLSEYMNNGILIVACDIDFEEQLIRTQESPYLPQNYYEHAFTKFDDMGVGEGKDQEPDGDIEEVHRELERVVSSVGLENAYPWNNTVDFKKNADALIKMASDETGRFEIYGIMSAKYGTYGLLLNDWIDGEQNWNFAYVPWMYSGAPSEQPILEPDGNGKYVFAYVCKYEDGVPFWEECFLDCGYDTGHMELLSRKETIENPAVREDYYEVATTLSAAGEIEQFALGIKEDVLSGDWASLSEKIVYPITISNITVNDSTAFRELGIDERINQEFVDAIAAESCREMFCNWQGIMMGATGQIWFTDVDEGNGTWELRIFGINGMLNESEETAPSVAGVTMVDTSKIASIIITNGNTGEKKTLTGEEADSEEYYFYNDLIKLYGQLDFSVQAVENERVGYRYSMALYDAGGNKLQMITPYKDGLTVDRVFYQYDGTDNGAAAS